MDSTKYANFGVRSLDSMKSKICMRQQFLPDPARTIAAKAANALLRAIEVVPRPSSAPTPRGAFRASLSLTATVLAMQEGSSRKQIILQDSLPRCTVIL